MLFSDAASRGIAAELLFERVVQILIRIEFRGVGGQIIDLDFALVVAQPLLDRDGLVSPQVVDDEDHFAGGGFNQALQESDKSLAVIALR